MPVFAVDWIAEEFGSDSVISFLERDRVMKGRTVEFIGRKIWRI